jgi:predicted ATPase
VHDTERKQSWEDAEATWQMMADIYEELRYTLVPLPKSSIEERVRFILERIESEGG